MIPTEAKDLWHQARQHDTGVTYRQLTDKIKKIPESPRCIFGEPSALFWHYFYDQTESWEVGLYNIEAGAVFGFGVLMQHDYLLYCAELGLHAGSVPPERAHFMQAGDAIIRRIIPGQAVLLTGPAYNIYGHWLIDYLPKLYVLAQCGYDIGSLRFLLPDHTIGYVHGWLDLLGIRTDQLIRYNAECEVVEIENLLVPTCLRSESTASALLPPASTFLQSRLKAIDDGPSIPPGGRIYISRKQSGREYRPLRNRDAIEAMAAACGFAIVHPEQIPIRDQVAMFQRATHIIGEYGSALHASIFSPIGTVVVALRGPQPEPGYLQSGIGNVFQQPTGYVFGKQAADDAMAGYEVAEQDFADCLRLIFGSFAL
jgi:capsular polysaccharide biosynthesis protein